LVVRLVLNYAPQWIWTFRAISRDENNLVANKKFLAEYSRNDINIDD